MGMGPQGTGPSAASGRLAPSAFGERGNRMEKKLPWIKWSVAALIIIALLWLLARSFGRDPHYIASPLLGRPAPEFRLELFGGREVKLEDFRGKAVFINFWASWCPPCRAEARDLESAWQGSKDDG